MIEIILILTRLRCVRIVFEHQGGRAALVIAVDHSIPGVYLRTWRFYNQTRSSRGSIPETVDIDRWKASGRRAEYLAARHPDNRRWPRPDRRR